jgi:hypothetical protein
MVALLPLAECFGEMSDLTPMLIRYADCNDFFVSVARQAVPVLLASNQLRLHS